MQDLVDPILRQVYMVWGAIFLVGFLIVAAVVFVGVLAFSNRNRRDD